MKWNKLLGLKFSTWANDLLILGGLAFFGIVDGKPPPEPFLVLVVPAGLYLYCRQFVILCRNLNLFANAFVAIDGSKFKAVNNRDRNFTRAKLKRRGTGVVGYNVQIAVDPKHHIIVVHEVTNQGSDRRQLANMNARRDSV